MRTPRLPGSVVVLGLALCSWVAASCGDTDPVGPRLGAVEVTTVTTGADIDSDGYIVTVDGGNGPSVGPSDVVVYPDVVAGNRTVELTGLAENCTASDNPRTVDVEEGETARETFHVVCTPRTGTIQINITTTGPGPGGSCGTNNALCDPDGYELIVNGVGEGSVDINDELTLSDLEAGDYELSLTDVAEGCTIADSPTRTVTVAAGGTAQVAFNVTCTSPLPVITFVESPDTVSNDFLAVRTVTVGFADSDADIDRVFFREVSDPSGTFEPFEGDPGVRGQPQGSFGAVWYCFTLPECPTGPVTVGVVLRDAAGHESEQVNFSFEVVD